MRWPLLGAVWLSAFLVSLDYTAVNVALPTLAAEFDVGTSAISWIALSYMLVMVALTLPAGAAIVRLGYAQALTWSLALFAVASLGSALASSLWLLVALRAAQGIGAAVMFAIGPAMIKTMFTSESRGRAFAIFSTAPTAGLCAGPAIGGELTETFGWEAIFVFSLATAILAMAMLRAAFGEASQEPARGTDASIPMANPLVICLTFVALLLLLLGLNQGAEWGFTSPTIVLLFATSIVIGLVVVAVERRASAPLIDRALFSAVDFVTTGIVFFPLLLVFGGSVFLVPFTFEWLRKEGTDVLGRVLMIQPVATIAASAIAGFLFPAANRRTLCLAGISLFVAGVASFAFSVHDTSLALPVTALALMGAGMGLTYPTLLQLGMAQVPDRLAASASSLQATGRSLAQLLGVVLFETVFAGLFPTALHGDLAASASGPALIDMEGAFHAVFLLGAMLAALALVPTLLLGASSVAPSTTEQA